MIYRCTSAKALILVAAMWMLGGCVSDLFDEEATATTAPSAAVRNFSMLEEDRFCDTMSQIRIAALEGSPHSLEELGAIYNDLLPDVPTEIRDDFEAMVAEFGIVLTESASTVTIAPTSLAATTTPSETSASANDVSTGELNGELWLPDSSPSGRVQTYVELHCTGTANNPGPQATVPP